MKYILKFTPEIILFLFILLFISFKDPYHAWDRVINSDGKGYYAYLPAIFIYHDLQFKFVEQYETQYYPSNKSVFKEFRNEAGDRNVDKYFPGMAIVWLPFFLGGHLFAYLELFPMDGYSLPYQFAIALSALFFLWLGARCLRKLLLLFGSNEKTAAFITFVITLGTNLIFFTIVEGSMTHVYSFALITCFALSTFKLFHDYKPKWFTLSLFLFLLITLIRPTNALVIMLAPFMAGDLKTFSSTIKNVLSSKCNIIWGVILCLVFLLIPLILWNVQTGRWLVYTYGNEKLNFFRPNILQILFSFNRGWFVYTPVAFLSLFGLIGLFRQSRFRFYWLLGFLLAFIYIVSCWWVWYYASKCGQRIFIDIYLVVAILLLYLYNAMGSRSWKRFLTSILIILTALNIFQFYQHAKWIYPPSIISGKIFWDSFLSITKKARVYLPEEGIVRTQSCFNDLEKDMGWMNAATRTGELFHCGSWSSRTDKNYPYGIGLDVMADSLFVTGNRIVQVSGWVYTPGERTESSLVVDFQAGSVSKSYNPFYMEDFAVPNKWTYFESAFYVPENLPERSSIKIYFFNPSSKRAFYIDDLKIDFISFKDEPDFKKIEGVILPVQ
ncbi:MAG: hypothetical protein WCO93_05630 [bacterium]